MFLVPVCAKFQVTNTEIAPMCLSNPSYSNIKVICNWIYIAKAPLPNSLMEVLVTLLSYFALIVVLCMHKALPLVMNMINILYQYV